MGATQAVLAVTHRGLQQRTSPRGIRSSVLKTWEAELEVCNVCNVCDIWEAELQVYTVCDVCNVCEAELQVCNLCNVWEVELQVRRRGCVPRCEPAIHLQLSCRHATTAIVTAPCVFS